MNTDLKGEVIQTKYYMHQKDSKDGWSKPIISLQRVEDGEEMGGWEMMRGVGRGKARKAAVLKLV